MSANSQFVSSTNATVAPGATQTAVTFLAAPNVTYTEAWVVGLASPNAGVNGPLRLHLVNQNGHAVSGTATMYGSVLPERAKLLNVNIPASAQPPVLSLVASNGATSGDAVASGVLLLSSAQTKDL